MAAPRIDLSRYPLLMVTFDGLATDVEFDEYLAQMARLLRERKTKSVTILDARESGRAPPLQRKKQADWLKQYENLLRTYSLGTAFVISSPIVRGVLTAILWVQPLPTPHIVVSTLAEAERWAEEQFRRADVAVSLGQP